MMWTVRYFMNQRDTWYRRLQLMDRKGSDFGGGVAYCEEQIYHWDELGRVADSQFHQVLQQGHSFWEPLRMT